MKAKILMPLAICTLSLILTSCSEPKEEPCEKSGTWTYYPITENERKLWPLNETDSFKMVSNKNVKLTFTGKKKDVWFESEDIGTFDCSYYNRYETILFLYYPPSDKSRAFGVDFSRRLNHLAVLPYFENTAFYLPFSYFNEANYIYQIPTNKGLIKCLAVGDSLYYSQTEGIIRYVENDTVYWTREF